MLNWLMGKGKGKSKKAKKKVVSKQAKEIEIGTVTHYFTQAKAAVFKVKRSAIAVGDTIEVRGHSTGFKQKIKSLEVNRKSIDKARPGQEIGLEVKKRVRINDKVFLIK